jgi:hypothetical protein
MQPSWRGMLFAVRAPCWSCVDGLAVLPALEQQQKAAPAPGAVGSANSIALHCAGVDESGEAFNSRACLSKRILYFSVPVWWWG